MNIKEGDRVEIVGLPGRAGEFDGETTFIGMFGTAIKKAGRNANYGGYFAVELDNGQQHWWESKSLKLAPSEDDLREEFLNLLQQDELHV